MFKIANIIGHKLSTLIGVVLGLSVGIVLFLFVYLGKGTVTEITPLATTILPVVMGFLLYGDKNSTENQKQL
jgi:hypothetical protein